MINSIAPWHGAKRKKELRDLILQLLGKPRYFAEPFCGSCAVSLGLDCKPSTHIVNDLHLDVINLAHCLVDHNDVLLDRCATMLFCEDLFWDRATILCQKELIDEDLPDLERAVAYLYVAWSGINGFEGTTKKRRFARRFNSGGGDGARRWQSVIESIPEWGQRMQGWTILNMDAYKLIEGSEDAPTASLYIDSPYHRDARSAIKYVHDFPDAASLFEDDRKSHGELEALLRRFEAARIVISHYDCPAIRDIYSRKNWSIIAAHTGKNLANAVGEAREAPEILIVNQITRKLWETNTTSRPAT